MRPFTGLQEYTGVLSVLYTKSDQCFFWFKSIIFLFERLDFRVIILDVCRISLTSQSCLSLVYLWGELCTVTPLQVRGGGMEGGVGVVAIILWGGGQYT